MWISKDKYDCMKLKLELSEDNVNFYKGLLDGYRDQRDRWYQKYKDIVIEKAK